MPSYSKEYLKLNPIKGVRSDHNLRKTFLKMPDDTNKELICDGFGIKKIINRDGDCFLILNDGEEISYEQLTGKSIGENYSQLINLALVITAAWILSGLAVYYTYKQKGYEARGTFGDMFGAVNALFSGLALGGIIYTIYLQKNELKLQRKELRQTRDEFVTQNRTLSLQRFENTFFQMLTLHHEIVDKLKSGTTEAREVFTIYSKELHDQLKADRNIEFLRMKADAQGKEFGFDLQKSNAVIQKSYTKFYKDKESMLSHYYRNLYHIFKFIHKTDFITPEDKSFYASLVRSQLSHGELHLIYYNCITDGLGNPKFLFLVSKYDVMQNFGRHQIDELEHHGEIFDVLCRMVSEEVLDQYEPQSIKL